MLRYGNRWTEGGLARDRCRLSVSSSHLFDQPVPKPSNCGFLQSRQHNTRTAPAISPERLYQPL